MLPTQYRNVVLNGVKVERDNPKLQNPYIQTKIILYGLQRCDYTLLHYTILNWDTRVVKEVIKGTEEADIVNTVLQSPIKGWRCSTAVRQR